MSSTADDRQPCPGCGRDLVNGECQTDGCPGPATEAGDTSASSLMGGSSDGDDEEQESVSRGAVYDPAEDTDPYRESMLTSAAENVPRTLIEDDDNGLWHELDEAERKERMRRTQIDAEESVETHNSNPDAVSEPAQLDWHAFARRYGFHHAGKGVQSRFVSRSKLDEATRLDDEIAGGGESFVDAALADESVPLMVHDTGRIVFRSEVLGQ